MFTGSTPGRNTALQKLWATCLHTHRCAPVTKQYNLLSARRQWYSVVGEVTVGLVENNGSLLPGLCQLWSDWLQNLTSSDFNIPIKYAVAPPRTFIWVVESGGKAPAGGLGTLSIRSWSSLQTLFTDFDCRNDQNLKISHSSPPDSWPVCFTVGGC